MVFVGSLCFCEGVLGRFETFPYIRGAWAVHERPLRGAGLLRIGVVVAVRTMMGMMGCSCLGRWFWDGVVVVYRTPPFCPPRSPSPCPSPAERERGFVPSPSLVEGPLHNPHGQALLMPVVP